MRLSQEYFTIDYIVTYIRINLFLQASESTAGTVDRVPGPENELVCICMCTDMCTNMCTNMLVDVCIDMCIDMCMYMYIDMCADM